MHFILKKTFLALGLTIAVTFSAFAQNVTVRGTVTDATGEPVIGASILVVNTSNGAVTDVDGTYSLVAPADAMLEVACMGYASQRISVQGRTTINVVLDSDAQALDALVVIGYGSARKADVTGSIASMGGDNLRELASGDFTVPSTAVSPVSR